MKFCSTHWNKLRDALAERGLDRFVSIDGEQAMRGLAENRPDPLIAAHNSIVFHALERVGLVLMLPNDDGTERCPLCHLIAISRQANACECGDPACTPETRVAGFEAWIDHAANEQLARFTGTAQG